MNDEVAMDGFQELHCPGCHKKMPFQVCGPTTAGQVIRYQCSRCKRLLYVKEGLRPVIVRDAATVKGQRPID